MTTTMKKIYTLFAAALMVLWGCDDYLDRGNLNELDNATFWSSESNLRLYTMGSYTNYFYGFGAGNATGSFFTFGPFSEEYSSSGQWTQNVATSANGWSFTWVRRHNIMLSQIGSMPISDDAKKHWTGVGRFFRAMEYADLTRLFGDVPWYDAPLVPVIEADLQMAYKPRDPMAFVATRIMEDYEYAVENMRADDGVLQVNKWVAAAYMSRHLLYIGSYMKYHNLDQAVANTLFEKAKWAADQVILSGKFQVADDYRSIFPSLDLSTNKEVIFFRQYETGKATHSLVSNNNVEGQAGTTVQMFNTYLAADGFPIKQSPLYNYAADGGKRYYADQYNNRDPRIAATFVDRVKLAGLDVGGSTTGIATWKFLPYSANTTDLIYLGSTNTTDAPVIRYGEVLLNYAEAAAELGQFDQAAADKTINKLRLRNITKNNSGSVLTKLPAMVVAGNDVKVGGVTINDPDRDPAVTPLMWEIRRERAVELIYENFRRNDLRRWNKYEYLKTMETGGVPSSLGTGIYFDLNTYSAADQTTINARFKFYVPDAGAPKKVFIKTLPDANQRRDWQPGVPFYERQYLNSVPLDQIKLYGDLGYELKQNPYWE
jgi:starch-binding outer membrane protein, SusD/RagB family